MNADAKCFDVKVSNIVRYGMNIVMLRTHGRFFPMHSANKLKTCTNGDSHFLIILAYCAMPIPFKNDSITMPQH